MKIIHVLNHFLPFQTAGTEIYVWTLSKHLQRLGCNVSVLIPNYGLTISENYQYDGLEVFKYAEPSKPERALITGQKKPEGLIFFIEHLKQQKPDIVHFHEMAGSNGISVFHLEEAKALGTKVIFTTHLATITCNTGNLMYKQKTICDGVIRIQRCAYCTLQKKINNDVYPSAVLGISLPFFYTGINPLLWNNSIGTLLSYPYQIRNLSQRLKRIENACDIIVPITNFYKNILLKNGVSEKKMKLVLQALPTDVNIETKPAKGITLPLKLIFIGRIDSLKGIPILIDVLKQFDETLVCVDIYGMAPDRSFLEECKQKTKNASNIRWMGKLEQANVVTTLQHYNALILPSIFSEMSPLVIQEAFAAGIPVIGSNVYGIAEQIKDNKNGFLFQFNNADSLKKVLSRLINAPDLLEKCKQQISAPTAFTDIAIQYQDIYKEVIGDF